MVMTNITAVLVNALAELKAAYSCKSENKKKKKIQKSERISSDLQQKPSKIYPLNEILLEQSHWWSDMKE